MAKTHPVSGRFQILHLQKSGIMCYNEGEKEETLMRIRKIRRVPLLLCAAVLLAVLLALGAGAIAPSYRVSESYRSSTYHKNLTSLPLTGDGAFDTLSVALSQYSYHEGSSTADLNGENGASTGNFTEYGYAFGKVGGTYGYAWCAVFVTWCLRQAGEGESAGGGFSSCSLWVARLKELGQYTARSAHTPKMGDLIFFRSSGTSRISDHVGLVREVRGGRVYTVEGNSSGRVSLRDYALSDTYIVGYGRPVYQNQGKSVSRRMHEDKAPGHYVVTYDFLNVRAAQSAASAKKGSLRQGEMMQVLEIKNGWGRILYGGAEAFVSLDYADFVAPSLHKITYVSEGKTLLDREFFSTDGEKVASFTPEREGYDFLGWEDEGGASYAGGDAIPAAKTVLTAVWRELPPPAPPETGDGENEGNAGNGMENEENVSPSPDVYPPLVLPESGSLRDFSPASRVASIIVGVLAAAAVGAWYLLRKRME